MKTEKLNQIHNGVTFTEGDTVRMLIYCDGTEKGKKYTLYRGDTDGDNMDVLFARNVNVNGDGCSCPNKWELVKKSTDSKKELSRTWSTERKSNDGIIVTKDKITIDAKKMTIVEFKQVISKFRAAEKILKTLT